MQIYCRVHKVFGLENTQVHYLITHRSIHPFAEENSQQHTYVAKDGRNDDTLQDYHRNNVPRAGTDSPANTKLTRAFLDTDKHYVAYTYHTAQQRQQSQNPEGLIQNVHSPIHLYIISCLIPYP